MNIFATAFHDVCFLAATFHDSSRLSTTYARCRSLSADYAPRVHSDPLAGRGPCDRPPWQGNQFTIRGADGHKGRALQMADTTLERPKVSRRALILGGNNSAAQLSPRLCEKIYTSLRESTCITARVLFVFVRIGTG